MGAAISVICSGCFNQGGSALHRAARLGRADRIEQLLHEADVALEEHGGRYGWTPLMEAVGMGQKRAAICLLDAGADIEARGTEQQTALHEAAENGSVAFLSMLLERGADIEAADKWGQTALILAAKFDYEQVVVFLVARGAHLEARDKGGEDRTNGSGAERLPASCGRAVGCRRRP